MKSMTDLDLDLDPREARRSRGFFIAADEQMQRIQELGKRVARTDARSS